MTPGGGPAADPTAIVHALRLAVVVGDRGAVSVLLGPAVAMVTDSGDAAPAAQSAVRGRARVADQVCAALAHAEAAEHAVNGQPGLVLRRAGLVIGIVSVSVSDGLISNLWLVVNRDKLRHWNLPAG